ncbi:MAG: type II toxin-antitoxin system RelE/ParE family toxin [Bacteroidales bacterium]|nr:type II toxin-antitoxin system RelE/ParE family toxin [Bacteroidales bacterium]
MTYKIITTPETEKDIEEAIKWYKDIQIGLALSFINELQAVRRFIHHNPNKIQVRYNNIRVVFLKRFPYGIHYKFEKEIITIVAIFHTSQNPKKWENS